MKTFESDNRNSIFWFFLIFFSGLKKLSICDRAIPYCQRTHIRKLTQLSHLSISGDCVPETTLLKMTNLKALELYHTFINTVHTLTNLERLCLLHGLSPQLTQETISLPKLTRLVCHNPSFFQKQNVIGICCYAGQKKYTGYWKNGERHGKGICTYGVRGKVASYAGDWKDDEKHGYGVYIFKADGTVYEGSWIHDKATGYGRVTYPNGDTYEGSWERGRRHGQGIYEFADPVGIKIEGTWIQGKYVDWDQDERDDSHFRKVCLGDKFGSPIYPVSEKHYFQGVCSRMGPRVLWDREEEDDGELSLTHRGAPQTPFADD